MGLGDVFNYLSNYAHQFFSEAQQAAQNVQQAIQNTLATVTQNPPPTDYSQATQNQQEAPPPDNYNKIQDLIDTSKQLSNLGAGSYKLNSLLNSMTASQTMKRSAALKPDYSNVLPVLPIPIISDEEFNKIKDLPMSEYRKTIDEYNKLQSLYISSKLYNPYDQPSNIDIFLNGISGFSDLGKSLFTGNLDEIMNNLYSFMDTLKETGISTGGIIYDFTFEPIVHMTYDTIQMASTLKEKPQNIIPLTMNLAFLGTSIFFPEALGLAAVKGIASLAGADVALQLLMDSGAINIAARSGALALYEKIMRNPNPDNVYAMFGKAASIFGKLDERGNIVFDANISLPKSELINNMSRSIRHMPTNVSAMMGFNFVSREFAHELNPDIQDPYQFYSTHPEQLVKDILFSAAFLGAFDLGLYGVSKGMKATYRLASKVPIISTLSNAINDRYTQFFKTPYNTVAQAQEVSDIAQIGRQILLKGQEYTYKISKDLFVHKEKIKPVEEFIIENSNKPENPEIYNILAGGLDAEKEANIEMISQLQQRLELEKLAQNTDNVEEIKNQIKRLRKRNNDLDFMLAKSNKEEMIDRKIAELAEKNKDPNITPEEKEINDSEIEQLLEQKETLSEYNLNYLDMASLVAKMNPDISNPKIKYTVLNIRENPYLLIHNEAGKLLNFLAKYDNEAAKAFHDFKFGTNAFQLAAHKLRKEEYIQRDEPIPQELLEKDKLYQNNNPLYMEIMNEMSEALLSDFNMKQNIINLNKILDTLSSKLVTENLPDEFLQDAYNKAMAQMILDELTEQYKILRAHKFSLNKKVLTRPIIEITDESINDIKALNKSHLDILEKIRQIKKNIDKIQTALAQKSNIDEYTKLKDAINDLTIENKSLENTIENTKKVMNYIIENDIPKKEREIVEDLATIGTTKELLDKVMQDKLNIQDLNDQINLANKNIKEFNYDDYQFNDKYLDPDIPSPYYVKGTRTNKDFVMQFNAIPERKELISKILSLEDPAKIESVARYYLNSVTKDMLDEAIKIKKSHIKYDKKFIKLMRIIPDNLFKVNDQFKKELDSAATPEQKKAIMKSYLAKIFPEVVDYRYSEYTRKKMAGKIRLENYKENQKKLASIKSEIEKLEKESNELLSYIRSNIDNINKQDKVKAAQEKLNKVYDEADAKWKIKEKIEEALQRDEEEGLEEDQITFKEMDEAEQLLTRFLSISSMFKTNQIKIINAIKEEQDLKHKFDTYRKTGKKLSIEEEKLLDYYRNVDDELRNIERIKDPGALKSKIRKILSYSLTREEILDLEIPKRDVSNILDNLFIFKLLAKYDKDKLVELIKGTRYEYINPKTFKFALKTIENNKDAIFNYQSNVKNQYDLKEKNDDIFSNIDINNEEAIEASKETYKQFIKENSKFIDNTIKRHISKEFEKFDKAETLEDKAEVLYTIHSLVTDSIEKTLIKTDKDFLLNVAPISNILRTKTNQHPPRYYSNMNALQKIVDILSKKVRANNEILSYISNRVNKIEQTLNLINPDFVKKADEIRREGSIRKKKAAAAVAEAINKYKFNQSVKRLKDEIKSLTKKVKSGKISDDKLTEVIKSIGKKWNIPDEVTNNILSHVGDKTIALELMNKEIKARANPETILGFMHGGLIQPYRETLVTKGLPNKEDINYKLKMDTESMINAFFGSQPTFKYSRFNLIDTMSPSKFQTFTTLARRLQGLPFVVDVKIAWDRALPKGLVDPKKGDVLTQFKNLSPEQKKNILKLSDLTHEQEYNLMEKSKGFSEAWSLLKQYGYDIPLFIRDKELTDAFNNEIALRTQTKGSYLMYQTITPPTSFMPSVSALEAHLIELERMLSPERRNKAIRIASLLKSSVLSFSLFHIGTLTKACLYSLVDMDKTIRNTAPFILNPIKGLIAKDIIDPVVGSQRKMIEMYDMLEKALGTRVDRILPNLSSVTSEGMLAETTKQMAEDFRYIVGNKIGIFHPENQVVTKLFDTVGKLISPIAKLNDAIQNTMWLGLMNGGKINLVEHAIQDFLTTKYPKEVFRLDDLIKNPKPIENLSLEEKQELARKISEASRRADVIFGNGRALKYLDPKFKTALSLFLLAPDWQMSMFAQLWEAVKGDTELMQYWGRIYLFNILRNQIAFNGQQNISVDNMGNIYISKQTQDKHKANVPLIIVDSLSYEKDPIELVSLALSLPTVVLSTLGLNFNFGALSDTIANAVNGKTDKAKEDAQKIFKAPPASTLAYKQLMAGNIYGALGILRSAMAIAFQDDISKVAQFLQNKSSVPVRDFTSFLTNKGFDINDVLSSFLPITIAEFLTYHFDAPTEPHWISKTLHANDVNIKNIFGISDFARQHELSIILLNTFGVRTPMPSSKTNVVVKAINSWHNLSSEERLKNLAHLVAEMKDAYTKAAIAEKKAKPGSGQTAFIPSALTSYILSEANLYGFIHSTKLDLKDYTDKSIADYLNKYKKYDSDYIKEQILTTLSDKFFSGDYHYDLKIIPGDKEHNAKAKLFREMYFMTAKGVLSLIRENSMKKQ